MREQKANYSFVGLKASRDTKMFCFSVAFGTRCRYLTRQKSRTSWCGCSPSIRNIDFLVFDDAPTLACGLAARVHDFLKIRYSASRHGHCFQLFGMF